MQGDISSNDSSLSSVKYWWKDINVGFTLDWIASATKQTKIIKTVGFRQVKKSPLLLRILFYLFYCLKVTSVTKLFLAIK